MNSAIWTPTLMHRLGQVGQDVAIDDGALMFSPGDDGQTFLIVLSGHVRVEQTSPSGRSIVLYRIDPVGSCVMTTSCMLSDTPYSAYGYAEGCVRALAIGRPQFENLLATDAAFRSAVFATFSSRLAELTSVIDDLLLNRMDQKLAQWLAVQAQTSCHINATHQQIATELGSAREVMSRALKVFEQRGWLAIKRGGVDILDADALQRYAKSTAM